MNLVYLEDYKDHWCKNKDNKSITIRAKDEVHGKKIVEYLEKCGGENPLCVSGCVIGGYYYIDIFTGEIAMKIKYPAGYEEIELPEENNQNKRTMKVGDKVKVRKNLVLGATYGTNAFVDGMDKYEGEIGIITGEDWDGFTVDNFGKYKWTEEMLIPISQLEDQDTNKTYPREMYVWDEAYSKIKALVVGEIHPYPYPYLVLEGSLNGDELIGYQYAEDIPEEKGIKRWEDLEMISGHVIMEDASIEDFDDEDFTTVYHNRNIFPTREDAESSLALAQLLQIRRAMIGDWEPDWNNLLQFKVCVARIGDEVVVGEFSATYCELSFSSEDMAEEFLINNEELVKKYFKL